MAKLQAPMDAEEFEQITGRKPEDDDLDRVNCQLAGTIGHDSCGWNFKHNCPKFEKFNED